MKRRDEMMAFSHNFGKGICNTNRCKILLLLAEGSCTVGEIAERIGISQPTASQHLKLLRSEKLISDEKRGQHVYYSVDYSYLLKGLRQIVSALETKSHI